MFFVDFLLLILLHDGAGNSGPTACHGVRARVRVLAYVFDYVIQLFFGYYWIPLPEDVTVLSRSAEIVSVRILCHSGTSNAIETIGEL
jgi:hypothetical protein